MATRDLTAQEFNQFKDSVVTDLIAERECVLDTLGDQADYKVVHAYPFYLEGNAYISIVEISGPLVEKRTFRIFFEGCLLKNVEMASGYGCLPLILPSGLLF